MGVIRRNMLISDIIRLYPGTTKVFERYGLGCSGCMGASSETLEVTARMNGISLDVLLAELNSAVRRELGSE